MKELNFKAVFAKAKTESEVKSLWAQVLNLSVKAQNERIAELKAAEKPKAKSETKSETKPKAKSESKPNTKPETKETKEKKEYTGIEAIKLTAAERKAVEAAGLKYVDYSEKSFAITGDTKPVKDIMKKLSGKPNRNLSCGFGWIFAKVNESAVLSSLNITK
jgi:hypothetical protein